MASNQAIVNFERLLAAGKDNALLRFGLGNEYLRLGESQTACMHLREALRHDPGYSAAWKLLGKALHASGAIEDALRAYREGIAVAEGKGDKQAAKEMAVFARRIEKELNT
jgi:predicted Zn-dependent protease